MSDELIGALIGALILGVFAAIGYLYRVKVNRGVCKATHEGLVEVQKGIQEQVELVTNHMKQNIERIEKSMRENWQTTDELAKAIYRIEGKLGSNPDGEHDP